MTTTTRRLTQEPRAASQADTIAAAAEARDLGSVFVTPVGQRRSEADTAAASARGTALGMTTEHGR